MKKLFLILIVICIFSLTACNKENPDNDRIYVGKVDILEDIYLDDKTLNLEFFSFKKYEDILCILEDEVLQYIWDIEKNIEVKVNGELKGYLHKLTISFDTSKPIVINEVIMEFDDTLRVFDIGSYILEDVLRLNNKYYDPNVKFEMIYPNGLENMSYINTLDLAINVKNFMKNDISTETIENKNIKASYQLNLEEETMTVSTTSSKTGNSMTLNSTEQPLTAVSTYLIYTYLCKITVPDLSFNYVKLDVKTSLANNFNDELLNHLSLGKAWGE